MPPSRSRATTADRPFYGVAEAIVAEVEDPEKECRVRVRLPWFDDGELSDWCRCVHVLAGNGYGATWTPEVGDEVLVGFVHGDMRVPVVFGGLYNGADKPRSPRTAGRNRKTLRTKAGHEVALDDSPGSEAVEVRTAAGHRLLLDDTANRITLEIANGPSVVLDQAGGSIVLKGTSITLEATTITISAGGTLDAKGRPIQLNS
ncbi:phage baseplate assembly protein V [Actinoplanes sp. NPDC023714]|uniref:phage baseplate assembly protein V n=1 Tax=Actinoplanes sp. NPDC023714 TaxID=3154322 RepID=UPI0033FD518E